MSGRMAASSGQASPSAACARRTEAWTNVVQDIGARKQAEERLQKGERKLRELLGALPAAVYVTDAAGHITYCNQSAINLWGIEPTLGKDKWCDLTKFYHADGSPMSLADCPTEIALTQCRQAADPALSCAEAECTEAKIVIEWQENGARTVQPPETTGYGYLPC